MKTLRLTLPLLVLALSACAGKTPRDTASAPAEPAPAPEVVIVRSENPLDYRFDMQQQGRQMNADEFEAWMKARGIRIATGKPGQAPADTKADGRDEQRNN
ncbi:hypothetical protein [Pseudoxanthomonas taiwanensis]|uniref:Lipoprotein n=1 Tax=Pseudoxanthomonas taiwanensis TaxID=176598 RepID=A0A921NTI5_9GAMM|nr:hypothetical protein [Pseudoxanthomonas taiwanensis]KAF1688886.1 hypothetical protein CR938_08100 [Pseudoxanthomonas taiwanensis]